MEPENNQNHVDDEALLDKEIMDSVNKVRAGEELKNQPSNQTQATGPTGAADEDQTPTGATGATGNGETGSSDPADTTGVDSEFRLPNKGKFESDESYEKRVELFDLVRRRKSATNPEDKQKLTEQITKAKGDLRNLSISNTQINNSKPAEVKQDEDPAIIADRERLKELGGATKEDVQEFVRQERIAQETKSTLDKFVDRTPELKDPDVREVFFDFVDANYVWQGKTGKELLTVLELARENMFRPSESIQERVLKGAQVQEKVNAMQFPGGTGAKQEFSPEMRQSIDELKATGMSEEKAIALLSD